MTDTKITSVVAREDNGNIQVTFTIPFEIIKKAQDETIVEFAKDVEIPGFRKGNAPLDKVAAKIPQNTLLEHSLGHILPKALGEAMEEHKLKLAIYPKFELVSAKEGEAWQIKGITCELPEVTLSDYKKDIPGELRAISIKKEPTREEKEQAVIKYLVTNTKVSVPTVLIEEEADGRLSNLLARLEKL
jgi:trigger factor